MSGSTNAADNVITLNIEGVTVSMHCLMPMQTDFVIILFVWRSKAWYNHQWKPLLFLSGWMPNWSIKSHLCGWLYLGQAKGRLTLGAKFETLWNDFLSAWSWGQHSKVYRTTTNNQLLLLEKKLLAFESIGVGENEQMHFLTNSTL